MLHKMILESPRSCKKCPKTNLLVQNAQRDGFSEALSVNLPCRRRSRRPQINVVNVSAMRLNRLGLELFSEISVICYCRHQIQNARNPIQ